MMRVIFIAVFLGLAYAAPVDKDDDGLKLKKKQGNLCKPVPLPKNPSPEKCTMQPIYDERFCVLAYECVKTTSSTTTTTTTTTKPCPLLDPFTHSDVHPLSDKNCETGLPGWAKRRNCQCVYEATIRDEFGCVLRFSRRCFL